LLQKMQADRQAAPELIALVYGELRRIAAAYMRSERATHTLQPTALIHEAWMRLADQTRVNWRDRAHFFGVSASMMRRVLVDHARERLAHKRGDGQAVLSIEWIEIADSPRKLEEMLSIHEALARLEMFDAQQARIVEMHYFAGMSVEETAAALGISARTVDRDWSMARAWLRRELSAMPRDAEAASPGGTP
jgi:RNA polymerase sigma factor (TIGR02999 family)